MSDATLQQIAVALIRPSPHNPRRFRKDDAELASLAESIRAKGVLQPILVRPLPEERQKAGLNQAEHYELIAGERRWRASQLAERDAIPAIVREGLTDQEAIELTVLENLQREDLSPLEEAAGVASLLAGGKPLAEVADQLGKPLSWVARRARLATLSPKWRALAADAGSQVSGWPASQLELVARLEPAAQNEFFDANNHLAESNAWDGTMTREELERELAEFTHELKFATWNPADATLLPVAGACTNCPKRSSVHPGLFEDEQLIKGKRVVAGDRCLDAVCWGRKSAQIFEQSGSEIVQKYRDLVVTGDKKAMPAFARGRAVVEEWEGSDARKGEAGAVPMLFISGPKRGQVEWRKFGKSSPAAKSIASSGVKPAAKPMAERRAQLAARRQAWMLKAVCGRLAMTPVPETPILLQLLVLAGTMGNASRPDHSWPKRFPSNLERELFDSVVRVLTRRWDTTLRWQGTKGMKHAWAEIEQVAGMVSMDLSAFEADAELAIPEPKSWAKEITSKAKKTPASKAKRK